MRHISFAMTKDQLVDGTKDVTRRFAAWQSLQAGELLRAVKQAMGLKKGEKVEVLAMILTRDVRIERLDRMITEPEYGREECRREGFPEMSPEEFVEFFCEGHTGCHEDSDVTRIEFRKVPIIREMFGLHMRHQTGGTMGYTLVAEDGSKIGAKSIFTPRGKHRDKHPERTIYTLYETRAEFDTAAEFITAYMETLR